MSTSCVRFDKNIIPYDVLNLEAKLVNFGVCGSTAKFPENINNSSGWFVRNSYIVNAQDDFHMRFDSVFTVMFWAKFIERPYVDEVYGNRFILILDDGSVISYRIPDSSISIADWNHYSIIRDVDNIISMRINGMTVRSEVNSAPFDLTNSSYIYLGNSNRYATGYDVITDDILIFNGMLYDSDFSELPDDYIDVTQFKQLLYIISSTGEVWGYGLEE